MRHIYETLEFNQIIDKVQAQCACSLGIEKIKALHHQHDYEELIEELELVEEAMSLINHYGYLPLGGLRDLTYSLRKADMEGMLFPKELLEVCSHIDVCKSMDRYMLESELDTPRFKDMSDQLVVMTDLKSAIEKAIMPDGTISDSASPDLMRIRRTIRQLESQVRQKMDSLLASKKDYLTDHIMTSRHDRFVLPVRSDSKHLVPGIVHGQSSSNQTVYIEPEAIVALNNQIASVKDEEVAEIERILMELSGRVRRYKPSIEANQAFLAIMDFESAKARYGIELKCCIPHIDLEGNEFILKEARHPLIDQTKVVANTVSLVSPERLLLITGSNTGGKSVTLKMAGLLSLMALSGLPIPALEATIPLFDEIYVDLGDEQSIEQSLSTFSSHMSRLVYISDHVTYKSLVLLDEIGSGTDPKEGESLAEAFLSYIVDIHCFGLASTHYSSLKRFAINQENVGIASVEFDMEKMIPTYRLIPSLVGHSYALEISKRYGLKESILNHALEIKANKQDDVESLMEKLENQIELARQKEEELLQLKQDVETRQKELSKMQSKLEKEKEKYMEQAREKANDLIKEASLKVSEIMDTLNKESLKPHEAIQAKRQLEHALYTKEEIIEQGDKNYQYQVGDQVFVLSMKRQGEVIAVKNDQVTVSLGGLKLQLKKTDLRFISKKEKAKTVKSNRVSIKKTSDAHYECNVIGMRYEEAMNEVDKFIDAALLHSYSSVRIIHGMGTGALRKGVHELLKRHKSVKSFRDGGANEGGLGATVAYFE